VPKHRDLNNFWNKIKKTESCWIWIAHTVKGYGQFSFGGKIFLAHRFMWELKFGPIPSGLCVCHRCDVPLCVNPDHLWLGTVIDNNRDSWNKNRRNHKGERHPGHKLTWEDIRKIRSEYSMGKAIEFSKKYGVTRDHIYAIMSGKIWREENKNV